ncbi:hypothetical protein BDQ17DRAFT_1382476 [Cyathus striatus]|nr:hypothetical protein BDQ17DRAFT_1382476 [Cyathus striatus]
MSALKPALFQPATVGRLALSHRIVHAPLTRLRNFKHTHVPYTKLMKEYYTQRSSPGTLIIAEGTLISLEAAGYANSPGIWSDAQVDAWKDIVDAVHAKGGYIYSQIVAIGRAAPLSGLKEDNITLVGPSPIPLSTQPLPIPHELTVPEIHSYINQFAIAAKNAIRAGFDGVEIHGANGYLIDQFVQDMSNTRSDAYGGSIEKRSRFALEVTKAVADAVGEDRVGFRVSPWSTTQELGMPDPVPQFTHLIENLKANHPNLAYLHAIEPRYASEEGPLAHPDPSNDFVRRIWAPRPLITAGGYTRESAVEVTEKEGGELIAFGRHFLANPDLPRRLEENLPLNKYDRTRFYIPAELPEPEKGYVDYPFYAEVGVLAEGSRDVKSL